MTKRPSKEQKAAIAADEAFAEALALTTTFQENFLDLAAALAKLSAARPERLRDFISASKIGKRKAQHLISIHQTFRKTDRGLLTQLGWTKLVAIEPFVRRKPKSSGPLLMEAQNRTVADLKRYLADESAKSRPRAVLLHFTDEEYEKLHAVLIAHGAQKVRGGLINKEAAVMHIVDVIT